MTQEWREFRIDRYSRAIGNRPPIGARYSHDDPEHRCEVWLVPMMAEQKHIDPQLCEHEKGAQ